MEAQNQTINFAKVAQDVIQIGLDHIQGEIDNLIKPSRELVKIKAQEFLSAYTDAEKIYNSQLKAMKKSKSSHIKQQIQLDTVRPFFDEFQNAINAYYNQLVKIMYVYMDSDTGAISLSPQNNTTSLLQINKNYGSVQYYLNEIKTVFILEDYDSVLLDAAEQSIYSRWQIAKKHVKKSQWLPILWKSGNIWEGAKVNNLGTIAEAYVNFYLAKYQFQQFLEENVKTYILDETYGAASVDNMSGFLIGDTEALGGQVQFAVKKDFASPANMKKVYDFTKACINSPDFIEQLGNRFIEQEKEKAVRNQVKKLENPLEKTYENLVKDIKILATEK